MTRFSIYISSLDSSPIVEAVMSAYDDYSSLRRPSLAEMYKFIMKAAKEEHLMHGDWESNRDEISREADQFIKDSFDEVRRFNYDGYSLIEMICKSRQ